MLLLLLKLKLLKTPPNYVMVVSRIMQFQLIPLQPNHQGEEHYIADHLYKPHNGLKMLK